MNLIEVILLAFLTTASHAEFQGPVITVDSLMNFINETSTVYKPIKNKKVPPLLRSTEDEIRRAGYPVEVHQIYTEDGHLLTLHRIPGPSWRNQKRLYGPKQPILIMHGFLGSSQMWLQNSPDNNLPYILADEGYDVWLGNFRTNYYSRYHLKYSTKDRRFWDISFHEMGLYDLPGMIDHILLYTGYSQLVYIGHSMGTTTFLVMCSLRPEYNSKILSAVLLSPVALTIRSNEATPLLGGFLFANADLLYKSLNKLRSFELFPRNEYLYKLLEMSCKPSRLQPICLDFLGQGYGEDRANLNLKEFGRIITTIAAGTSIKTAHHLSQLFNTGEFRLYDYGPKGNEHKYGSRVPPDYPLDRVTAPIYMYYGLNDVLMNTRSVNRLARALPNVLQVKMVEYPKFSHLDFLFGNNARKYVYDSVLATVKQVQGFDIRAPFYL